MMHSRSLLLTLDKIPLRLANCHQPLYYHSSIFKKLIEQGNEMQKKGNVGKPRQAPFQNLLRNRNILEEEDKEPISHRQSNKKPSELWVEHLSDELKQFKEQHSKNVKQVDAINQRFLGVRLNTKYKKFYNEATFESLGQQSKMYRIDDLPFNYQQKQAEKRVSRRKSCQMEQYLLEKVSQERLKKKMHEMAKGFFTDLINKKRTVSMQPNFEWHSHSVIRSLEKSSYAFEVIKEEIPDGDQVFIKDIYFLKGVSTIRNDNYSVDSYKLSEEKLEDEKLIQYSLWKSPGERYPESEWEAMKNIMVRFETIVNLPFIIDIAHPSRVLPNVGLSEHEFVFQMDLVLPPKYAEFRLSEEDLMKSYRVNLNKLMVSNVDSKNPFYAISFKESLKEKTLINKLI